MKKKINDILGYFDEICPNQYDEEKKIQWLNEIDEQIFNDVISTREHAEIDKFTQYTDVNDELLVETPYTEIYRYWLEAKVHFANREIPAANNAVARYNEYLENYTSFYNRSHKTKSDKTWIM